MIFPVICVCTLAVMAIIFLLSLDSIGENYKKYKMKKLQELLTPYGTLSEEEIFKRILYLHYNKNLKWSYGEIYRYCHNNCTAKYKNLNIDIYYYELYENVTDAYEIKLHSTEDILSSHDINIKIPRINVNNTLYEAASLLYQDIEFQIKGNSNNTITDTRKTNEQLKYHYNVLKDLIK